jgi:hypothetical protein
LKKKNTDALSLEINDQYKDGEYQESNMNYKGQPLNITLQQAAMILLCIKMLMLDLPQKFIILIKRGSCLQVTLLAGRVCHACTFSRC